MKQSTITGLKKKLLLVELPKGCSKFVIKDYSYSGLWLMAVNKELNCPKIKVPNIKEIGKLTGIKEEQFEELVPEPKKLFGGKRFNYKKGANVANTAKQSFFSKLESLEIPFENPFGEYPTKHNTGLEYGMEYIGKQARWEEAQEKVWDLNNCYLFEIQ